MTGATNESTQIIPIYLSVNHVRSRCTLSVGFDMALGKWNKKKELPKYMKTTLLNFQSTRKPIYLKIYALEVTLGISLIKLALTHRQFLAIVNAFSQSNIQFNRQTLMKFCSTLQSTLQISLLLPNMTSYIHIQSVCWPLILAQHPIDHPRWVTAINSNTQ